MGADPGWGSRFLIGGLLSFVPVLNIVCFGYLLQYGRRVREEMDLALPEWAAWGRLFMDGLLMLAIWAAFFALPVGIGFAISTLLAPLLPGFFGVCSVAWLFLAAGWVLGCYLFMASTYRFLVIGELGSLLDYKTILRMAFAMRWQLALPVLVFTGMVVLLLPLYGLTLFFGFLILIAYSTVNFMLMERAAGINR